MLVSRNAALLEDVLFQNKHAFASKWTCFLKSMLFLSRECCASLKNALYVAETLQAYCFFQEMLLRPQDQHLQNMFSGHCGSRTRIVSMSGLDTMPITQTQGIVHSVNMNGLVATSTTFTNSMQCIDYVCSPCFC